MLFLIPDRKSYKQFFEITKKHLPLYPEIFNKKQNHYG